MSDQVSDILSIPVIIILLAMFTLGLSYLLIFVLYNANGNQMNVQCTRFADAMSSYVSTNAGFSDQGAGSFANYVADYVEARPLNCPCIVIVKAWNRGNTTLGASIYETVPLGSSAFWVLPESMREGALADINAYNNILNRLNTQFSASGAAHSILGMGNRGVLQEEWAYEIQIIPFYRLLNRANGNNPHDITIASNGAVAIPSHADSYTFNRGAAEARISDLYYRGSDIVNRGMITNYTKKIT